jgi:two-component system OmpR family response regulator
MRCLVVEDEEDTARYIRNGLTEAGHTATVVRDGASGLDLATNERWEVIILDRMLPGGVDGLSILATIRDLGKTTPVLILSALASLDERVRGSPSCWLGSKDWFVEARRQRITGTCALPI